MPGREYYPFGEPTAQALAALRAFLADRDVPCPTCGSNLRDEPTSRCPECGGRSALVLSFGDEPTAYDAYGVLVVALVLGFLYASVLGISALWIGAWVWWLSPGGICNMVLWILSGVGVPIVFRRRFRRRFRHVTGPHRIVARVTTVVIYALIVAAAFASVF